MTATVDPLLPLSLLEAVRAVDTPSGEHEAEFVHELRNKRLGLSDTVFAQIKRYSDAVRRKQRPPFDEAVALATLVGRRPDAEAVFREGGRILARQAYRTISPVTRRLMLSLPSLLSRPSPSGTRAASRGAMPTASSAGWDRRSSSRSRTRSRSMRRPGSAVARSTSPRCAS